jgi:hypothetical protein
MYWEQSVQDYFDNWYERKSPLQDMDWFNRQKEKERRIKVQKELDRLRAKRPKDFIVTSPTKTTKPSKKKTQ